MEYCINHFFLWPISFRHIYEIMLHLSNQTLTQKKLTKFQNSIGIYI